MIVGVFIALVVVALILFVVQIVQPRNFARAFRVSQTCKVSIPPLAEKVSLFNCNVFTMFKSKRKRIIFFPGGAFIRCCIDFTPFTETALNGYEIVMVQYRTLMQVKHMRPVVSDCAQVLDFLLKQSQKPTLVIGYSAGGYMATRAIEESNSVVPFLGMHGYYNLTTDYLLKFYSWLYVRDPIRQVNTNQNFLITGDKDPLKESTDLFSVEFGITEQVVQGADHFTFYDLQQNEPYVDRIKTIMSNL